MRYLLAILLCLAPATLRPQSVQVPYSGSAPYSGNVPVLIQITGLPSGCVVGTPTYSNGVIITPVTNCGSAPVAPTITCSPASVATGGASTCSGSQPITSWTASAGTISSSGVFTAPSTAQTVSITGTNANGTSAPFPVAVTSASSCAKNVSPTGGQDNQNWNLAISAAGGACVEVTPGTYSLAAWTPPASTNLLFDDGVTVQDFGIFGRTTYFFSLSNNNVTIAGKGPLYSAVVMMPTNYANAQQQNKNPNNDYEYQHCFALLSGVKGIVLSNFTVKNCGGDGVNFNNTTGATLTNVNSVTNIRQGYSVTGPTTGVTINGGNLHDGPLSGFDIEPSTAGGNYQITINNLQTNNNAAGGTSFGLMNLTSSSTVNIVANGLTSIGDSGTGIAYWNGSNMSAATGTITCNNCKAQNSGSDAFYGQRSSIGWQMIFNNPVAINSNQKTSSGGNQTNTALGLQCNSCTGGAVPGGVQFNNATITGGHGSFSFPSNSSSVTLSGTYNGSKVSYP